MSKRTTTLTAALTRIALCAAALSSACSEPEPAPAGNAARQSASDRSSAPEASAAARPERSAAPSDPEELAREGRQAYLSNCIACHNADPTKDGALGPAVAGASLELLEARVLRGEYPEGYAPKRDTAVMVAMPFLERQLPALAAYLAASER